MNNNGEKVEVQVMKVIKFSIRCLDNIESLSSEKKKVNFKLEISITLLNVPPSSSYP